MKVYAKIALVVAVLAVSVTGFAEESPSADATQGETVNHESVVLPWQQDLTFLGGGVEPGVPVPCDPDDPACFATPKTWCCKPNGTCSKVKVRECNRAGGTGYPTQNACFADVNC